ncbi:serine/threonine-protein kinase [Glycomyces harbinensis]|uniref:non-specific serine/threonine protein kinase n=1 Tax=Glycomyces harbinensis TaxID=58114 RepID=A0A1G6R419_9ACTN|nr:serine/threonine-protein kinase [Glycomyces harbinensis]SDC99352.1 serine/threonine-protein kinase PknG [Glycomyces harbinensis]
MTHAGTHCVRPDCPGEGSGVHNKRGFCNRCGAHIDDPVEEPPAPRGGPSLPEDEFTSVFIDPVPPESQRRCRNHHRVGFTSDGRSGPLKGTCESCHEPFDFTNHLKAGVLVANQYEVLGCIAHGGFGGIYKAHDRNLDSDVILKGLLNPDDPEAQALVEAERRFLVTVKHPHIVDIHNSVKHRFPDGAEYDYLVMDFVPGKTLGDKAHPARHGRRGVVSPIAAAGFGLQILDAFAFLHRSKLVYCDLKPSNIIQSRNWLTIIDLGAMRHLEMEASRYYGTPGYQAPEVALGHAPDVVSDLRTVGRTLAVLTLGFDTAELVGDEVREIPLPERPDAFNESLYLFLERACHTDRRLRFQTAEEMADQLQGVLRQLLAEAEGDPTPLASNRFGSERGAFASELAVATDRVFDHARGQDARAVLPVPLADRADTSYSALAALAAHPASRAVELAAVLPRTDEVLLTLLRLAIETDAADTATLLEAAETRLRDDWRLDWFRGVRDLADRPAEAKEHFEKVRRHLPGELAPMLALAVCAELDGQAATTTDGNRGAARRYAQVWRVDRTYPSAAFGIARCSTERSDRLDALAQVPAASSQYLAAQQALIADHVRLGPSLDSVSEAAARLDHLGGLDTFQAGLIEAEIWRAALAVLEPSEEDSSRRIHGVPLTRNDIGAAYEAVLRRVALYCDAKSARWALVLEANRNRPRTWL